MWPRGRTPPCHSHSAGLPLLPSRWAKCSPWTCVCVCVCVCSAEGGQQEQQGMASGPQHGTVSSGWCPRRREGLTEEEDLAQAKVTQRKSSRATRTRICCLGCSHWDGIPTPHQRLSGEQGTSRVSACPGLQTLHPSASGRWLNCSEPQLCHLFKGTIVVVPRA